MATRTALGTNTTAGATSLGVSMSAAINAGEFVSVGVIISSALAGTVTCSDGTNTYTKRVEQSARETVLFDIVNAAAVPINTTVTVSWTGGSLAASMWVTKWNLTSAASFDKSTSASGTSATPDTGAAAANAAAVEVAMAIIAISAASVTFSAPTGGFTIGQSVSSANGSCVELFKETTVVEASDAGCTLSASSSWFANLATYNEGLAAAGPLRLPRLPTLPTLPTLGSPS